MSLFRGVFLTIVLSVVLCVASGFTDEQALAAARTALLSATPADGLDVLVAALKADPQDKQARALWDDVGANALTSFGYDAYRGDAASPDGSRRAADCVRFEAWRTVLRNAGIKVIRVWLASDSTVADYAIRKDYLTKYKPMTGWGETIQPWLSGEKLTALKPLLKADVAIVVDRAIGGRSTRTFWEEGSWKKIYDALEPDDVVLVQFGHNDSSENYPDRYTPLPAYAGYLKKYVEQTREKGANPILVSPMNRNYPWNDGVVANCHGEYPQTVARVVNELKTPFVDLATASLALFNTKGRDYVKTHYFMISAANVWPAYPKGASDNTHFQGEGAGEMARLVYEGLLAAL